MRTPKHSNRYWTPILIAVFLIACTDNVDDEQDDDTSTFETIEITFEEGFETECGGVWTVDRVNLSISPFTEDEIDPDGFNAEFIGNCPFYRFMEFEDGAAILLAQAAFEIDFRNIEQVSKITIAISDNAGGTQANLYQGDTIIDSSMASAQSGLAVENLVFETIPNSANRIRIWSFEGFIIRVIIER